MPHHQLADILPKTILPGVAGRYVHTERMTFGVVELAAGAAVPPHSHPHEQISYVLEGQVEFAVGDDVRTLGPGACAVAPGGTPHHARALTACRLVDVFTPPRDDYK